MEKSLLFLEKLGFFLDQAMNFNVILKIFVSWFEILWIKQMVEAKSSCLFSLKNPKSSSSVSSRNFEVDSGHAGVSYPS